jgi:hypothetical protein
LVLKEIIAGSSFSSGVNDLNYNDLASQQRHKQSFLGGQPGANGIHSFDTTGNLSWWLNFLSTTPLALKSICGGTTALTLAVVAWRGL